MSHRALPWLPAVALALALAPRAAPAAPAKEASPEKEATPAASDGARAFGPGEVLEYELRFGPIKTGRARVVVGADREDGRERWPIVFQARTTEGLDFFYELRERFVTFWEPDLEASLAWDHLARNEGRPELTRARLDPEAGRARVERQRPGKPPKVDGYPLDGARHDVASALFWLRTRPLEPGDVETVPIFTGKKSWELVATVEDGKRLKGPEGPRDTVRVRLQTRFDGELATRRDIVVWMTDDDAHVPLRIEAEFLLGALRADLSKWLPGRTG